MKNLIVMIAVVLCCASLRAEEKRPGFRELAEQLEHKDASKRRRAVRGLAALGERKAWELVIQALSDPKGEVADEAQLRLAGLDDAKLLRPLLGKAGLRSKDEWVRRRVAEVFGRMTIELDCEDLALAVTRKDAELSEMLLWSVERLARARRLAGDVGRCGRELERLASRRGEARIRAQALCSLRYLDEAKARELAMDLLTDKQPLLRAASVEVLCALSEDDALTACKRLVADEDPGVRAIVLDGLVQLGTREAFALLIGRLEGEPRVRLAARVLEVLQELSGMKYRADVRPWRLWLSKQPADFTPQRGGQATEPRTSAALAGLPILSDRLAILIDFSGSLWYEREGRPPRKLKVDAILRETLPRLPQETWFNLIPYTREPHPWRPSLVQATKRNVKAAMADFEAATMRGSGNVFDAALLALADPDVDRILIFTDGAPTGGQRWNLELMVPLLEQAARWRQVAFDSVLVDTPPGLARRWQELSARTGGRSKSIDL